MTRGRVSVQKVTSRFQDKDEEGRQVLGARGGGRREEGGLGLERELNESIKVMIAETNGLRYNTTTQTTLLLAIQ
jgi:hypothetical protein